MMMMMIMMMMLMMIITTKNNNGDDDNNNNSNDDNIDPYVTNGTTHGVTVSMSAFLACHQCYCAGLSLVWGLNLRALVCGIF